MNQTEQFPPSDFPPSDLRHYALLADGERGALVGPHGEIAWLCAPGWHDGAVFSTLLGGAGTYAIQPADRCVWGGYYEPGTLIWHNRWATEHNAIVECRDALSMPGHPRQLTLLRRVVAVDENVALDVMLDVRADFGHHAMLITGHGTDDTTDRDWWTFRSGDISGRWSAPRGARADSAGRLVWHGVARAGEQLDFALELGTAISEPSDTPLPDAHRLWEATERAWHAEVPQFDKSVAPRDTQHAYAILRGLTSRTGGMVAAATMSLPEQSDEDRNYDYRYAWIRDECYVGLAMAAAGPLPLLDSATRFVAERLLADGDRMAPAYTITGGRVPEQTELDLPGYPGAIAVAGNRAASQFQLDAFGEALQLFAAAGRLDMLDADGRRAAQVAVAAVTERWQEPDAGIWELDNQWWTHSRLSCVAGLRQFAGIAASSERDELLALADAMLAETARRCTHVTGRWQRSPRDSRVDAALMLPSVRGALPADDPRTVATLAAVRHDLVEDGYVYRYAPDDGSAPGDAEGAFLLCGFILSLAELQQGNRVEAFRWFERNRAASGPPGLLSEEFDVRQRQLRGNLPQSFVHALLFETAVRLT